MYRGTEVPRYRGTEIPRYRGTANVPRYRDTEVSLMYRGTEIYIYIYAILELINRDIENFQSRPKLNISDIKIMLEVCLNTCYFMLLLAVLV